MISVVVSAAICVPVKYSLPACASASNGVDRSPAKVAGDRAAIWVEANASKLVVLNSLSSVVVSAAASTVVKASMSVVVKLLIVVADRFAS